MKTKMSNSLNHHLAEVLLTYGVKSFICKLVFFSYFSKLLLSVNMMSDSLRFNLLWGS